MLSIRPATAIDIEAVIGIAPAGTERREAIAEWVLAGQCHIAWRDDLAAGYVVLTRSFFRSPFIEMLVVAPAARRTGVGRALVEHCITLTRPVRSSGPRPTSSTPRCGRCCRNSASSQPAG